MYCIRQKFSQAKIFAKGSYYVSEQKFHPLHKLPSRKLWVDHASCYTHMCVCSRSHECVKIFTVQKIHGKNFRQRHALAKNFLLTKISTYMVFHCFMLLQWCCCGDHVYIWEASQITHLLIEFLTQFSKAQPLMTFYWSINQLQWTKFENWVRNSKE